MSKNGHTYFENLVNTTRFLKVYLAIFNIMFGGFERERRNPVKLERARKVWYLLLLGFWLLLPRFNFWKGDWWLFPNFLRSYRKSFGNSWRNSHTRYQISLYLWQTGPVLKHCEVLKYYDQDCRVPWFVFMKNWFFFDSKISLQSILIVEKNKQSK